MVTNAVFLLLSHPDQLAVVRSDRALVANAVEEAMRLIPPVAPDSLMSWGYFNAHLEQKEYMEAYVAEDVARKMLDEAQVKAAFEARLKAEPEPFARAVLECCVRPRRELPIGWGAQKLLWGQKLSPRLGDWMLRRSAWKSQHTGEPKPTDSPDNLYETLSGDPGAHGRFDDQARESTLWTSLRLRRWLVGGTAVAAAGAVAARELARAR